MSPNPLTISEYYIFESSPWTKCVGSSNTNELPSYVSDKNINTGSTVKPIGPMNLFRVSEYIQQEITGFLLQSQTAGECELTKRDILTNSNSTKNMPDGCDNFIEYSGAIQFGSSTYVAITDFPTYKKPTQIQKNLCQRIADLNNLLKTFNTILNGLKLSDFPDQHTDIVSIGKNNVILRRELDLQLQLLYSDDHNIMKDNTLKLDSTIYATVLWSILASSITYYVFMKL